jgi:hypothetical protein
VEPTSRPGVGTSPANVRSRLLAIPGRVALKIIRMTNLAIEKALCRRGQRGTHRIDSRSLNKWQISGLTQADIDQVG